MFISKLNTLCKKSSEAINWCLNNNLEKEVNFISEWYKQKQQQKQEKLNTEKNTPEITNPELKEAILSLSGKEEK